MKPKTTQPSKIITLAFFILIVSSTLIIYGYKYPSSDLIIETPPVFSLLNPELYQKDYYIQDTLQITPRYYYQYFTFLIAKAGLGVAGSYFFYYILAFSSYVLGLYAIGKRFGRSKLSGAVLVFLGLFSVGGTVGYVSLFRSEPMPAVLAMGLTIWGFYHCFYRRWVLGYLLFGLACVIHFLVGFLPGFLMAPLLIIDTIKNHKLWKLLLAFIALGTCAGIIYLPMAIAGHAGSHIISDREFVYLYGYLRQPHHILVSSFPIQNWISFLGITLGGILCIYSSELLSAEDKRNLSLVILVSFFALLLGYIFVEIYPITLFVKLQFARTTPFAQLMALIAISVLIQEHYRRGNLGILALLLVSPINKNGSILFILVACILFLLKNTGNLRILENKFCNFAGIIIAVSFLALYPLPSSPLEIFNHFFWWGILLLLLLFPFFVEELADWTPRIQALLYTLTFASLAFLCLGLAKILPANISNFLQNRIVINPQPKGDLLTKLALRFKEVSHEDALVLTPPSMTEFRFYSQRSIVYSFYSIPYTEKGIKEWGTRLEMILGKVKPPLSWRNIDSLYRQRSTAELVSLARRYGANYILSRTDWHTNVPGKVLLQEGKWVIYQIESNNAPRKTS